MRKLLVIYLLFSCIANAQRPLVQLEVSPKVAEVGQSITITVKANIQGELEVDLPSSFEGGNSTMSSMQQEIDYNTGKVVSYFIHSQNGSFIKSGSFTVGPAYIRRGNKVFKSNTANISVKKEEAPVQNEHRFSYRQLIQPAFGVIQLSKKSVYEGEPIILSAKIYSRFSPTHLEGYEAYEPLGAGEKTDLDNDADQITLREERIGQIDYYSFSYDKKLIFPLNVGKINVKPYTIVLMHGFESFPLTSSPASIEIKPLPKNAPKSFTGGVGKFNIIQKLSSNSVKQDEIVTLTRTLSGQGNLHLLNFPELKLPNGFELYGDPDVKEDLSFGSEGAKGKITYTYHLKSTKPGVAFLPSFALAYFDPDHNRYVQLKTSEEKIDVTGDPTKLSSGYSASKNGSLETFQKAQRKDTILQEKSFVPDWFWIILSAVFGMLSLKLFRDNRRRKFIPKEQLLKPIQTEVQRLADSPESMRATYLNDAKKAMDNGNLSQFYFQLEKTMIWTMQSYVKKPELNRTVLLTHLESHHLYPELIKWFSDFDASRYGMGISGTEPKELLERAEALVNSLV